jgi:flagellin
MVINSNIPAKNAASNLQTSSSHLSKSLARLSSGLKIISPADDAGGLAAASRLDAQIARLNAAKANVGNAMSFTQTQDGYLQKIGKALNRMSELSILAQDATKPNEDRDLYDKEFQTLKEFIREAGDKEFNGVSLFSNATLQVTTDGDQQGFDMLGIDFNSNLKYTALTGLNVQSTTLAEAALAAVKLAIEEIANDRATIGSYQARLNITAEQLMVTTENLSAASSKIQDTNIAEESTNFARHNILTQAATSMLAQANQLPGNVLRLLQ